MEVYRGSKGDYVISTFLRAILSNLRVTFNNPDLYLEKNFLI